MRTVTFQSIYEGVLRRHGLDPVGATITQDTQRTIAKKATTRLKYALDIWDWPEFSRTEERAFRSIWNNTRQFKRVGEDGAPDEVYYIPGSAYYVVKGSAVTDPPVGTLPTNATYFDVLTAPEPFVDRDQTCRRTLGTVLGVYKTDPSLNGCSNINGNGSYNQISFRPSERGIRVSRCDVGNTVFLWYLVPPSEFTMRPYIAGKTYQRGDRVYYAPPVGDGNCYRAIATNSANVPTDTSFWALEPVPAALADFLEAGVYSDCLREGMNGEPASAAALQASGLAETEAQGCIQREIDKLIAQGQKHFYGGARWWRATGLWSSQPWGGDKVIALSDVCEADWIFPPAPSMPQAGLVYFPDVNSLKTTAPTLISKPSLSFGFNAMAEINTGEQFKLVIGAANNLDPGQGQPSDYSLGTHNFHWEQVV